MPAWNNTDGGDVWQKLCKRLEEMAPLLREEFLNSHTSVHSRVEEQDILNVFECKPGEKKDYYHDGWQSIMLRYPEMYDGESEIPGLDENYPVAASLIREFEGDVCLALYSCLGPHSVIPEHSDVENPTHQYIRIHVPLIIPEGDCWFEVHGEKYVWTEGVFGFDGGSHAAFNHTDDWRVILLIDIDRKRLGI
jgi:hypothetical protein